MPLHKQVTTCLKTNGPLSDRCSCEHCCLAVCSVCGAWEGGLTTDCPGETVSFDRQSEVGRTSLDYTDARGWHQGEPEARRSPRFEQKPLTSHTPLFTGDPASPDTMRLSGCKCGWRPLPIESNPDDAFAWHAAGGMIFNMPIKHHRPLKPQPPDWMRRFSVTDDELAQKAVLWVMAERMYEDHAASLTRVENEIDAYLKPGQPMDERGRELHEKLEHEKMGCKLADRRLQKCDEEFRQAARRLVEALEK